MRISHPSNFLLAICWAMGPKSLQNNIKLSLYPFSSSLTYTNTQYNHIINQNQNLCFFCKIATERKTDSPVQVALLYHRIYLKILARICLGENFYK